MTKYIIQLVCHNCAMPFERRHDRVLDGKNFCCIACRKMWHKENTHEKRKRNCKTCGKSFVPRQYQLDQGHGKYCSIGCSIKNLQSLPRTKEWCERISKSLKGGEGLRGSDNGGWKGGKYDAKDGYTYVLVSPNTYMTEHRFLMQEHLGRRLAAFEVVHHINHDKSDNRIKNLMVMTRSEHAVEHDTNRNSCGKFAKGLL